MLGCILKVSCFFDNQITKIFSDTTKFKKKKTITNVTFRYKDFHIIVRKLSCKSSTSVFQKLTNLLPFYSL